MKKTAFSISICTAISLMLSTFAYTAAYAATPIEEIQTHLASVSPRLANVEVEETAVEGVYRFWAGADLTHVYYADGHLIIGDMLDLERKVSLGSEAKQTRVAKLLNDNSAKTIVYGPKDPKRVINVFTDIDCGWCRRLHNEIPTLTAAGIQVRYYAFPRAGLASNSAKKYQSVWCSTNQQTAMDDAKAGKDPEVKTCENPIADTYQLGQQVGVRGTPNIILDDGSSPRAGFIPAADLINMLGLNKAG